MAGARFVEKCFALAGPEGKEAIAAELAASEQRVAAAPGGGTLLARCQVDAFRRGGDGWRAQVASADSARREFQSLFADDGADAGGGSEAPAAGEAVDGGSEDAEKEGRRKKKARRHDEELAGGGEQEPGLPGKEAGGKPKKRKSKKAAMAEEPGAPAGGGASDAAPRSPPGSAWPDSSACALRCRPLLSAVALSAVCRSFGVCKARQEEGGQQGVAWVRRVAGDPPVLVCRRILLPAHPLVGPLCYSSRSVSILSKGHTLSEKSPPRSAISRRPNGAQ
jgi:hypothetical protein